MTVCFAFVSGESCEHGEGGRASECLLEELWNEIGLMGMVERGYWELEFIG